MRSLIGGVASVEAAEDETMENFEEVVEEAICLTTAIDEKPIDPAVDPAIP